MEGLIVQLDFAISEAAQIQQRALDAGNLSVALGASRRVAEARREALELRQATGRLPKNLGLLLAWHADAVEVVRKIRLVFERHDIPDAIGEEVADLIELERREDHRRFEPNTRSGQGDVMGGQAVA
jgi:hypothetical protein